MVDWSSLFVFLLMGGLAGWLAGLLVKGHGFGLVVNILVGILGAVLGGLLFDQVDIGQPTGFFGDLLVALLGAVVLLAVAGLIGRLTGARR